MWWLLANLVLAVHILLWLFLGVGVVVTATGWMRRHHKLALFFWSTAFVTLGSMAAPGCILSDVERWLRNLEVPGWRREMSLARTISGILTGCHPPEAVFTALGILLLSLAIYAFVWHHLKDVWAWLQRANR